MFDIFHQNCFLIYFFYVFAMREHENDKIIK